MKGMQVPAGGIEVAKAKVWLSPFGGAAWTDLCMRDAMQRS